MASVAGFQGLGLLEGGYQSRAYGVSADGSVVVGRSSKPELDHYRAFIWDEISGARNAREVLGNEYGLDLTGWTWTEVPRICGDAVTIVGWRTSPIGNTEAWAVTIPKPARFCLFAVGGLTLLRRRTSQTAYASISGLSGRTDASTMTRRGSVIQVLEFQPLPA